MKKKESFEFALRQHEHVPPNWYYLSLKIDPFQRYWHKRRFEEVSQLIEPAASVLDIGSADGMFSKIIFDRVGAKKFVGMDILASSVKWATKHWKRVKEMEFIIGDAHDLGFKSNNFDAVFIMEVLEHVKDPVKVLKEVKRVIKKGGYGVFLVPSDNNLFKIVWWLWLHFYPRGWVWRETHIQTYRGNYLPKVCKEAGFKIEVDKTFNLGMLSLVKVRKI